MKMFLVKKVSLLFILACGLIHSSFKPITAPELPQATDPPFLYEESFWVDSLMNNMTIDEKIGQLFMVAAYSNRDIADRNALTKQLQDYNIGGLIFFKGSPLKQARLTNYYQGKAKIPLLVAMDAEWGLGMRLDSTINFPRQLVLGAIRDNSLVEEMGYEIGRQLNRMGVHINFAPVVDVNNNSRNPVIGDRSFGEDRENVAQKGIAYMNGLQNAGVLACAKHFPGHGDTDKDSHYALPVIKHDWERLDSIEMYPFKKLIEQGVGSIMIAHLSMPALDNAPIKAGSSMTIPTTLSKKVVTGLLKDSLQFKGLIFTDALNMKGVSSHFAPGDVDLKAFMAGNDVLLFPENVPAALQKFKAALQTGAITQEDINHSVRKILKTKYWAGLSQKPTVSVTNLKTDLNNKSIELLNRRLTEGAFTLAKNNDNLIPFTVIDTIRFASIAIGASNINSFQKSLGLYAPFRHFQVSKGSSDAQFNTLYNDLKNYNTIVISLHNMSRYSSKGFGVTQTTKNFIKKLSKVKKVVLCISNNPYSLQYFDDVDNAFVYYWDTKETQTAAAQALFGASPINGQLPITASPSYKYGQGLTTYESSRLKYTIPQEVGIYPESLNEVDKIVAEAINSKMTPGCQIMAIRDGKVFFHKAYGHHTYNKTRRVQLTDIYDLASVTKISATTLTLMEMYDEGQFDPNATLATYIPEIVNGTDKADIIASDVMLHQGRLTPWIPFYTKTLNESGGLGPIYSKTSKDGFSVKISDNIYMRNDYVDSMYLQIAESDLRSSKSYKYSDLGFYLFRKVIENQKGVSLDVYANQRFYKRLGLHNTSFNPKSKFPLNRIIPSENDSYWRNETVQGYVHDMGAAMMGGIGGHAGLFSNANDLGIIMQMMLNKGYYGGFQYIQPETIEKFTSTQNSTNRRGLGFDKPYMEDPTIGPTCASASENSFGHTGFTGTYAWADPDNNLVYIFLSNRTYPTMDNKALVKNNIRTRIQQVFYDAIEDGAEGYVPIEPKNMVEQFFATAKVTYVNDTQRQMIVAALDTMLVLRPDELAAITFPNNEGIPNQWSIQTLLSHYFSSKIVGEQWRAKFYSELESAEAKKEITVQLKKLQKVRTESP